MQKKLKILFIPIHAVGHVNSAIGMAQVLIKRGHEVLFLITDQWKDKLTKYGIKEVLYQEPDEEDISGKDPATFWAEKIKEGGLLGDLSSIEKVANMYKDDKYLTKQFKFDKMVEEALKEIRPDVMVCDQVFTLPSINNSGIPWVLVCSCNPLFFIEDLRTPPNCSGMLLKNNRSIQDEICQFTIIYLLGLYQGSLTSEILRGYFD